MFHDASHPAPVASGAAEPDTTPPEAQAAMAVHRAVQQARTHYRIALPEPELDFSLRGRCAGQALLIAGEQLKIRINRALLAANLADYLAQTIPHEVAHLVVNWQARQRRPRPRPHGPEWQAVMRDCYGLPPQRCHAYATEPARVVPRPYLYACACREHRLTALMHRRLRRSRMARCRACGDRLVFLRSDPAPR